MYNYSKQFALNLDMVVGDGAECISCSAPLLRHLVHVRRPPIALQCLVLLARTSSIREGDFRDALLTLFLKTVKLCETKYGLGGFWVGVW